MCVLKKRLTRQKSREWVQFHRTRLMSPLMEEERGSLSSGPGADLPDPGSAWASPNSDLQVGEATVSPRDSLLVPVDQSLRAAPEAEDGGRLPRTASTFHVTTKPVVFHPVWERMQRRHTPEDHPAYKYKLDTKVRHLHNILWLSFSLLHSLEVFNWTKGILQKSHFIGLHQNMFYNL